MPLSCLFNRRSQIALQLDAINQTTQQRPAIERYEAMQPTLDAYLTAGDEARHLHRGTKVLNLTATDPHYGGAAGQHIMRHTTRSLRAHSPRFEVAHKLTRRIAARLVAEPGPFQEPTALGRLWNAAANPQIDPWAIRLADRMSLPELQQLYAAWQAVLPPQPRPPGQPPAAAQAPQQTNAAAETAAATAAHRARYEDIVHCLVACFGADVACLGIDPQGLGAPETAASQALQRRVVQAFAAADLTPLHSAWRPRTPPSLAPPS